MAKLIVEVLNARDLLPSDHHGSASPFVQVEFNGHSQHTQTRTRDLYPTWNENLVFDIENPRNLRNSNIQVILYDDHRGNHHKGFLGCVRISGASVSLLESEASVRQYPLCKQDSFSHGRGDISLKIYTIRAQYFFGNQQPHSHLNNRKAPKPEGSTKHDDKYKGGDKRRGEENEARNVYSSQTSGGIIMRKDRTNTSSSVYFSPALCYLRLGVIEARHLAPLDSNRQPELFVMVTLENPRIVVRTRTFRVIDRNPVWKEDFILVVSEKIRCNNLIVDVFDRINKFREEFIGRTVVPLNAIPERSDSTVPLKVRWFSLNGVSSDDERIKRKKQGKILLGLCLETGYHVSDGSRSGFQPFAKHMRKDSIGNLELQILNARGLPPMKKQIEGGRTSTDAYCVAKYGNKWVRTRTIVNSREPHWNEHYAWEVYDPCTEIRICILDDCQKDHRDARMGRVCIQLQTLEANRIYTQYYPLLVLTPSGLKNIGELQVAVRFTCVAWANMVAQYAKPLLPKMNYLLPLDPSQLDILRHNTVKAVESSLTKAMPHIKKEVVHYMLDPGSCMWSLRKQKANFKHLMSFVMCITTAYRWFDDIRHWRNPMKTIFIHFFYLVFVWYPKLILPTFFFSLLMMGLWNYRFRPRDPPHLDARLSQAETIDPDHLDEEFDTFPTSRPSEIVKLRYDRLRSIAGRYQTVAGDIATLGEKAMAILTCTDMRATSIFTLIAFFWIVFIYMVSFRIVAMLLGLYWLRHPWLRTKTPSLLVNLFNRLPSKMDTIMLL